MKKTSTLLAILSKYFVAFMLLNETVFNVILKKQFWYLRLVFGVVFILFYIGLRVLGQINKPISKKEYLVFALFAVTMIANFGKSVDRCVFA